LEDLNRAKNRIEQLCQSGNIKVSSVATDLFGVSGRKMLKAIVENQHDAGWMADYARGQLRNKRRELELALQGTFTDEQRWLLEKELRQVEWLEGQVEGLEEEIERRVSGFEEAIQRLLTIPGIDRKTAWTIVAEVGVDLSAFADAKHLASWSGLCPGNRESGGKRMSGRTRKANRYVKRAMCQAAWAASHSKNTYLSAFYRRMAIKKGSTQSGDGAGASHDRGDLSGAEPEGRVRRNGRGLLRPAEQAQDDSAPSGTIGPAWIPGGPQASGECDAGRSDGEGQRVRAGDPARCGPRGGTRSEAEEGSTVQV
jgi:hypothetical protein